jgi:hypothetical protein
LIAADIGSPAVTGCARREGDCLVVFGGGREILQRADQFQFTYTELSGDQTATVRVDELVLDGSTGRIGLMFRESADPGAAFAFIHLRPGGVGVRVAMGSRASSGATAATRGDTPVTLPVYLRLKRVGSEFIGSTSSDGEAFTELADRATLGAPPAAMLVGMAVTARDSTDQGTGVEATFCDLQIGSGDVPRLLRADANNDGSFNIADAQYTLNRLFIGGPAHPCEAQADSNGDGRVNIADAQYSLNRLFLGGPPPPAPSGACEPATDSDIAIGCEDSRCGA